MPIPYLYFMDTNHISELDFSVGLDIVYDKGMTASLVYKKCSGKTNRSVIVFGECPIAINDAHIFFISGLEDQDVQYNIILKLNQLLSISFCTIIGCGAHGDAVLRLNVAGAEPVAKWTLSMIINPDYSGYMGMDLSKIRERNRLGTHLFYVLQNRKDLSHYDRFFNGSMKGLFIPNLIQGWSYQIPSKSFYADNQINQHAVSLSSAELAAFLEYMSFNKKDSEALALYSIYREY
jgi:hypothetical protein